MRSPDRGALVAADERLGDRAQRTLVAPFYLELMGTGAIGVDEHLWKRVALASRRVTDDQVRLMLQGTWRPLVMGAWYAIARDDVSLTEPVHDALETCLGDLTAPALITATLFYSSERTLPLLRDYAATDRMSNWGQANLADAAAHRLATTQAHLTDPTVENATAPLDALLARGAQLRRLHATKKWR